MTLDYEVNRYAAYFRGWCQSFGEHDSVQGADTAISWLFSVRQVGFILPPHLTRSLYRQVLGQRSTPVLELGRKCARMGSFHYPLSETTDQQGIAAIKDILENDGIASLFLTSHFMYGTGARILTLSSRNPRAIIYKEIGSMVIRLG